MNCLSYKTKIAEYNPCIHIYVYILDNLLTYYLRRYFVFKIFFLLRFLTL